MEKEEKKEEVKEEKKEKNEIKTGIEKIKLKKIREILDAFAKIGMVVFTMAIIACVVMATITTVRVSKTTKEELIKDDRVTDYMSTLNNDSLEETKQVINDESKGMLIAFNIILPTIVYVSMFVILIASFKKLLDYMKDIKQEKELFTKEKLKETTALINSFLLIGMIFFIWTSSFSTLILFIALDIALVIIFYLFKKCVENEDKIKKLENK